MENSEEKINKTPNKDERFDDGECSNLGTKPLASEFREDNSVTVTLKSQDVTSIESSKSDDVVSETETQSMTYEETEKISAITIADKNLSLNGSKSKPGVILLGRGNSFSLGRSEVILLHNRPVRKSKDEAKRDSGENHLDSIQEQSNAPPSPPPISEGVSSKLNPPLNGWKRMEDRQLQEEIESDGDDGDIMDSDAFAKTLHKLWSKAEKVMTANEGRVLKVLEEFGIGEQAGGGGDDGGEGMQEEEQVWQIVQENYRSQQ